MTTPAVDLLTDRLEIADLLTRYALAIDTDKWDLLDSVFTPDARIDYSSSGGTSGAYPEVKAWLAQILPMFYGRQHFVTNSTITFDDEQRTTATGRTYFYNPMGWKDEAQAIHMFYVGGYYHDRLVRTAGGWRIAERVEEQAWVGGEGPQLTAPK